MTVINSIINYVYIMGQKKRKEKIMSFVDMDEDKLLLSLLYIFINNFTSKGLKAIGSLIYLMHDIFTFNFLL